MGRHIWSKRLKREMKPVSESRVLWEGGQQVRRSDKQEVVWVSEKSRVPVAVRRSGKLRLSEEGRDYYLKKRMVEVAPPIIDALVPKIKPSPGFETKKQLLDRLVERVRGATSAEEKEMHGKAAAFYSGKAIVISGQLDFMPLSAKCAHELTHSLINERFFRVKNEYLAVCAIDNYIAFIGTPRIKEFQQTVEKMLEKLEQSTEKPSEKEIERVRQRVKDGESPNSLIEAWFSGLGHNLALKAIMIEMETGQPGSGLFFLREVLQGKDRREAEAAIRGKPSKELKIWQRKHGARWIQLLSKKALRTRITSGIQLERIARMKKQLPGAKKWKR